MKRKIIIVSIILIIVILVYLFTFRKEKNITDIKAFSFYYTTGTEMFSNVSYKVTCETSRCTAIIKPNEVPDTETKTIETDLTVKEKIKKVLKKYHVEKWDNFNKIDKHALDGNSFKLNVTMEKESLRASGYMKYPKNYKEFSDEIDAIFLEIYKK